MTSDERTRLRRLIDQHTRARVPPPPRRRARTEPPPPPCETCHTPAHTTTDGCVECRIRHALGPTSRTLNPHQHVQSIMRMLSTSSTVVASAHQNPPDSGFAPAKE
jgi:hypothetical protein